jgi:hypothetical protein
MYLANSFGFFLFLCLYMLAVWGYWKVLASLVAPLLRYIFRSIMDKHDAYLELWN